MSADDARFESHLTPSGWVTGTFLSYGHGTPQPRPADAVETLQEPVAELDLLSDLLQPQVCVNRRGDYAGKPGRVASHEGRPH